MNSKNNQFHFNTNVQLKSIIGKDLINDDNIAILELVKNSYDADARNISVEFQNITKNNDFVVTKELNSMTSRIIISDDGNGMDLNDLVNKWLNIAWSDKKKGLLDTNKIFAGSKGVGRFSCDRLGEFLTLITNKDNNYLVLKINWNDFEIDDQQDTTIQSIPVTIDSFSHDEFIEKFPEFHDFDKGTILDIRKLRYEWSNKKRDGSWSKNKLLNLKRYLEKFINPNQEFIRNSFDLYLAAREFSDDGVAEHEVINGKIENKIYDNLIFRTTYIISEISEDGSTITTSLFDKGRRIFEIKELNEYEHLRNIKITVHFLNQYAKIYFARYTGIRVLNFGSVFLFLNGFRVSPYGDEGNDWLSLEERKGQGFYRYLGNRDIIGRVEVQDSINAFQVISNREGLVKNTAFKQLTYDPTIDDTNQKYNGYYFDVHRKLERYVVDGLDWDRAKSPISEKDIEFDLSDWDEIQRQENYLEDRSSKDKRILDKIFNIARPNLETLISLDINEEIIKSISEEEENKTIEEYQKLLDKLSNLNPSDGEIKVSIETLESLKKYKNRVENLKKERDEALLLAIKEEEEKRAAQKAEQDARKQAGDYKVKADQKEQEAEKLKNTASLLEYRTNFFKQQFDPEFGDIAGIRHHLNRGCSIINDRLIELLNLIKNDPDSEKKVALIRDALSENSKFQLVAGLADKADFSITNFKTLEEPDDLVSFIYQYTSDVYSKDKIRKMKRHLINVELGDRVIFETKFNPIDIMMILDNMFDNAKKANAKKVEIAFQTEDNSLVMKIRNDGKRIDEDILNDIFELGFTTTDGHGIGLFFVKRALENYDGDVSVCNLEKGVEFSLRFRKWE